MAKRYTISFIAAVTVPVLMVLFLVIVKYVPPHFVEPPQHDFVYTLDSAIFKEYNLEEWKYRRDSDFSAKYYAKESASDKNVVEYTLKIVDNKLTKEAKEPFVWNEEDYPSVESPPQFFRYDIDTNTSEIISFEDAAQLKIDENFTAPDGYALAHGRDREEYAVVKSYLRKNFRVEELTLDNTAYDVYLVGWIIE